MESNDFFPLRINPDMKGNTTQDINNVYSGVSFKDECQDVDKPSSKEKKSLMQKYKQHSNQKYKMTPSCGISNLDI